jgi:glutathione S-transferase
VLLVESEGAVELWNNVQCVCRARYYRRAACHHDLRYAQQLPPIQRLNDPGSTPPAELARTYTFRLIRWDRPGRGGIGYCAPEAYSFVFSVLRREDFMAITFYAGSGSPVVWRVWLTLEHKQLAYALKMLSFSAGDLKTEEFAKLNPRQKVPVIVDEDFALYESVAIVEYLDDRYPDAGRGRIFPSDDRARALRRRLVQETDQYMATAMGPMLREIFFKPADERDRALISEGREKLKAELARFEQEVRGDYLVGALTAADFTLYPMLALALRADLKEPEVALHSLIGPKLTAWMGRIEALPYFERTIPPHWQNA